MADQVFGAQGGIGVSVIEKATPRNVTPAATGTALIVGRFERGAVGLPTVCTTRDQATRRLGGRFGDFEAPHTVDGFFAESKGSGRLIALRVTDGTEESATTVLYTRHWGSDFIAPDSEKDDSPQVRLPCLRVSAANGGTWGGAKRIFVADVASVSDVAETTLTTGVTMLLNEWAGATLTIYGSSKSYIVVSNTTGGVITVKSDSKMDTDLGTSSEKTYSLSYDSSTPAGAKRALSVQVFESSLGGSYFGLRFFLNGEVYKTYENVTMNSAIDGYVVDRVNRDASNKEILVEDLLGADADRANPLNRPANLYGRVLAATARKMTYQPASVVSTELSGKLGVAKFDWSSVANAVSARITVTYVHSGTKLTFSVAEHRDGGVVVRNLPDLAATSANDTEYEPGTGNLPKIYFDIGTLGSGDNGKTLVLDVVPFDVSKFVGVLTPDASRPGKTFKVKDNFDCDANELSIEAGDLTTVVTEQTVASVTGSNAGPFNTSAATGLVLKIDGRPSVTITLTAGSSTSASTVANDINTALASAFPGGDLDSVASVTTDSKIKLTSPGGVDGGGPGSSVQVVSGSSLTALGLTAGVTYGSAGSEFLLSYAQPCSGGYDGGAPTASNYQDVLGTTASDPMARVDLQGYGVFLSCLPEVLGSDQENSDAQQALFDFCETKNHHFFLRTPSTILTESDAIDFVTSFQDGNAADTRRATALYPSYGYIRDPDLMSNKRLTCILGDYIGLIAYIAKETRGYAAAPAGKVASFSRVLSLPTGDQVFDTAVLTPYGINSLKYANDTGRWYVYGVRTLSKNPQFKFLTSALAIAHCGQTILREFDWVIFSLNTPSLWAQIRDKFTQFFQREFANGQLAGARLEEAFFVKCDKELNPPEVVAAGECIAEIEVNTPDPVERFKVYLGRGGVSV